MGIFIRNDQTEALVRELARRRGTTITGTIEALAREALAAEAKVEPPRRRYSLAEMRAATEKFRRLSGLDIRDDRKPMTKADWDALWPTGIPEIDNA